MLSALGCAVVSVSLFLSEPSSRFLSAKPVWPQGREKDMNLMVGFRAGADVLHEPREAILRIAAASVYRLHIDGQFAGHGPARAAQGFFRVDEWNVTRYLHPGRNVLAIEVASYNLDSYYVLNQPAFLQAELVSDGQVLAASGVGKNAFEASILTERVRKVQRYSYQRTFTEVYRVRPECGQWRQDPAAPFEPVPCALQSERVLLARHASYPDFSLRQPVRLVSSGTLKAKPIAKEQDIPAFLGMGLKRGGFPVDELETKPAVDLAGLAIDQVQKHDEPIEWRKAFALESGQYAILDLGTNLTGFPRAHVTCREKTRLCFVFDEIMTGEDVDFKRGGCANFVTYELAPGTYDLETFEPYTMRYVKLVLLDGRCDVERVCLREIANPDVWTAHFAASDNRLNRLFAAARETFRQNAVDIFTDCPSRERAGWLCDSLFTSRAAMDFCGNTRIEHDFLENFLLPEKFPRLPDGMLPMCYPADYELNSFIPNWAMWFVLQLEEYVQRGGDRRLADGMKPRITKLLEYFKRFENSDGLLEKLESWVFVEWSAANDFVQDVNYPSNMLYAAALESAGRIYAQNELIEKAGKIRDTIRRQSFDGEFFFDNAVRKDGKLTVTRNRTETCQYYAFFLNTATPQTHAKLWQALCEQFGPSRAKTRAFPEIHASNAFIGNVLRLELLSRNGRCQQLLDEAVDFNLYMADRTGTLWENIHDRASCNHGFASHLAHVFYRDVLGIQRLDPINRKITLRFAKLNLDWCEGRIPTADGYVSARWWKTDNQFFYRIDAPAGYAIELTPVEGVQPIRKP